MLGDRHFMGETLADWLRRVGRVPQPAACELVRGLARALAAAHAAGIVHRDLSPANVFVTMSPRPQLLGIRRQSGARLDPSYAAPELARPGPIDGRADLYSLGCILHAMVCGRPPNGFPLQQGLDEEVSALLARLLARSPHDRFRSAGELVDALGGERRQPGSIRLRAALR